MALTPRLGQLSGVISQIEEWHAFLDDAEGNRYFAFWIAFDSNHPLDRCHVGDPVVFTPIQEDSSKRRLRAIEVRAEPQSRPLAE